MGDGGGGGVTGGAGGEEEEGEAAGGVEGLDTVATDPSNTTGRKRQEQLPLVNGTRSLEVMVETHQPLEVNTIIQHVAFCQ